LRDILLIGAWGLFVFFALDAFNTARRNQHELIELAALAWLIAMVVGGVVAAVVYLRVARWNRRFETDQCPECGYDLRATRDRCPECGFEVTSGESNLPAWLRQTALHATRGREKTSSSDAGVGGEGDSSRDP
jgi:hypothetical protein